MFNAENGVGGIAQKILLLMVAPRFANPLQALHNLPSNGGIRSGKETFQRRQKSQKTIVLL